MRQFFRLVGFCLFIGTCRSSAGYALSTTGMGLSGKTYEQKKEEGQQLVLMQRYSGGRGDCSYRGQHNGRLCDIRSIVRSRIASCSTTVYVGTRVYTGLYDFEIGRPENPIAIYETLRSVYL